MLLTLLLEKLYCHRSDLEFIMQVQETHYSGKSKIIADQYSTCLSNIKAYEMLLQQHNEESFSNNSHK